MWSGTVTALVRHIENMDYAVIGFRKVMMYAGYYIQYAI